jgi:predicted nucleotidyltransferase
MNTLEKIIARLNSNNDVDAVFVTGSLGVKTAKPYSDIDLVVILKENKFDLYSLYRWIDGIFSDIFFFDLSDIKRISVQENIDTNATDGTLISWLKKADIRFDKSGATTDLKRKLDAASAVNAVSIKDKESFWQKINYNFVANKRYFESSDPLYHQALELRLLYSVIEVICGYIALRDIPWRGEKNAVTYLSTHHPDFYALFQKYSSAPTLKNRFAYYSQMINLVFTDEYKKWTVKDETLIKKDFSITKGNDPASNYVKNLFND